MKNKKLLFIGVLTAFLMLAVPFAVVSVNAESADADVVESTGLQQLVNNTEAGGTLTLDRDYTLSSKLLISKDVSIDGNGYTLTYAGSDRAIDSPSNNGAVNLTIKNLTISFTKSYCERGISFNNSGSLTLDNVEVLGGTAVTYALNLPTNSDNATVTITNSSFIGNIALNIWGSNSTIAATDSDFTSCDEATHENYAAISLNNNGTDSANGTSLTINGGAIISYDENNNPWVAIRNSTIDSDVSISSSTEVIGSLRNPVAVQLYQGYDSFYSFFSLQDFVNWVKENSGRTGDVNLIRDVVLDDGLDIDGLTPDIEINGNGHTLTVPEGAAITVGSEQTLEFSDITLNNEGMIISEGTVSVLESGSDNVTVTGNGVFTGTDIELPGVAVTESSDMGDKTEFSGTDSIVIAGDGVAQSSEVTFNFSDGEDKITITFPKGSVFDNVSSVSAIKWNTGIEEYGEVYDVRFYGIDAGNGDILITLPRTSLDGIVSVKNIDENGDVLERMEIVDITADYITFSTTHNSLYAVSYTQLSSGNSGYYPDDGIDSNIIYIAEIVLIVLALAGLVAVIRRN